MSASFAAKMADAAKPAPPYGDGDLPTPGPWKAALLISASFDMAKEPGVRAPETLVKSSRQPDRSQEEADPASVAQAIVDCSYPADICSQIVMNALSVAPGDSGHTSYETLTQTDLRA